MLIYIGVGLTVTTMCIDLVGIKYMDQIHYYGRKMKGTDLRWLKRRRRELEAAKAQMQLVDQELLNQYLRQQVGEEQE
jgi:hypothetical protein